MSKTPLKSCYGHNIRMVHHNVISKTDPIKYTDGRELSDTGIFMYVGEKLFNWGILFKDEPPEGLIIELYEDLKRSVNRGHLYATHPTDDESLKSGWVLGTEIETLAYANKPEDLMEAIEEKYSELII